jgi:hypothetical protein
MVWYDRLRCRLGPRNDVRVKLRRGIGIIPSRYLRRRLLLFSISSIYHAVKFISISSVKDHKHLSLPLVNSPAPSHTSTPLKHFIPFRAKGPHLPPCPVQRLPLHLPPANDSAIQLPPALPLITKTPSSLLSSITTRKGTRPRRLTGERS